MIYLSKRIRKLVIKLTLLTIISSSVPAIVGTSMVPTASTVAPAIDANAQQLEEAQTQSMTATQIHSKAYKDTIAVRDAPQNTNPFELQTLINQARQSINKLKTVPGHMVTVQTWSPIVDKRQHPIFVNITNAINSAIKQPTQDRVDRARSFIPANLPTHYKASYSSAIDGVQQTIMKEIVANIKTASDNNSVEALNQAKTKLSSMKKSPYTKGLTSWIKVQEDRIRVIEANIENSNKVYVDLKSEASRKQYMKQVNTLVGTYINDFRESQGVSKVKFSEFFSEHFSYRKSKHMIENNYFDHRYPHPELYTPNAPNAKYTIVDLMAYHVNNAFKDIDDIDRFISDSNPKATRFQGIGGVENITGHGFGSSKDSPEVVAERIVKSWVESPGHRRNLLIEPMNKDQEILMGIGFYIDERGANRTACNPTRYTKVNFLDQTSSPKATGYPEWFADIVEKGEVL